MMSKTSGIHAGNMGQSNWGQSTVPVFQSTAYAYETAEELEAVFAGRAPGFIYTRIANPTNATLERRLNALEDGVGCIATASGMAALATTLLGLLSTGDEMVAGSGLFGGTVSLLDNVLGRWGIKVQYADVTCTENIAAAITPKTRLILVETIGNPRMDVPDLPAIAELAQQAGIPLIVDSTVTPPTVLRPKQWGADIVVHSTSKFINGHGTAIGGAIIDTGRYDWATSPFESVKPYQRAGQLAFLSSLRNGAYRDLGACPAPQNSFLMLQGLETLALRMPQHCANAARLAKRLRDHAEVAWVNYPGLEDSPFYERIQRLFGGVGGALLTFGLGSKERAFRFINALELARNLANLGDAKTLVIHPASTIFHEFEPAQQAHMGVTQDMLRVSVGLEDFSDVYSDFRQAIDKV